LATHNGAESREDEFQVFVSCDRVEFAHEKDVFRWPDIGKRQIANHFERQRRGCCGLFAAYTLLFLIRKSGKWVFIFSNPSGIIWGASRR
jgi:hypothetical protein